MPLRPSLLDLRQYPLCERSMQTYSSLEGMVTGDTLLIVNDNDPQLFFGTTKAHYREEFHLLDNRRRSTNLADYILT